MAEFLTAVLELLPSRRKAAAIEWVRAEAETICWDVVAGMRERADAISAILVKKDRKAAEGEMQADISRVVLATTVKVGLAEPVAQGLVRDITGSVTSYVELRANGHAANWPTPLTVEDTDYSAALDDLLIAATKEQEDTARDDLARISKLPGPRPLTIARSRDAALIRKTNSGPIVAVLNILRGGDERSRVARIDDGFDAASGLPILRVTEAAKLRKDRQARGEAPKPKSEPRNLVLPARSDTRLVIPVACSKWHEQKFLNGRTKLRSSLIVRRGDRWFLCAQFEMAEPKKPVLTGARLGVDRGIANPVAVAVVNHAGAVIAAPKPAGSEISDVVHKAERRRRAEQRRRGVSSLKHARQVDHHLHHLANDIVRDAKAFGAQVVVEKLDGFKATIRTKRAKGARKNRWQKSLKNVQLGKLETILDYKLKLAGLPPAREVFAARTSITCPGCGATDPKSRVTQDQFTCTGCGFQVHADTCGAVNVARRDIAFTKHKKGGDFAALERDMVAGLRSRDDGGLGPLAAGLRAAGGFVAVRATIDKPYEPLLPGLNLSMGQNAYPNAGQNSPIRVFAERGGANSGHSKQRKDVVRQALAQGRLL